MRTGLPLVTASNIQADDHTAAAKLERIVATRNIVTALVGDQWSLLSTSYTGETIRVIPKNEKLPLGPLAFVEADNSQRRLKSRVDAKSRVDVQGGHKRKHFANPHTCRKEDGQEQSSEQVQLQLQHICSNIHCCSYIRYIERPMACTRDSTVMNQNLCHHSRAPSS